MRHYSFIDEYREIDKGARPGDIIYGTMLVLDEEISKLNAKPLVLIPYPPSWHTENQPYLEALAETIDNLLIDC